MVSRPIMMPIGSIARDGSMYQKIMVPVDGSEASARGLAEAVKIAKQSAGHLRLIHIVDDPLFDSTYSAPMNVPDTITSRRDRATAILSSAEEAVAREHLAHDTRLIEAVGGSAAQSILQNALEWPADLIVMGTHGRRGIRRLALGSDAETVIRSARVPVVLVRAWPAGEGTPKGSK